MYLCVYIHIYILHPDFPLMSILLHLLQRLVGCEEGREEEGRWVSDGERRRGEGGEREKGRGIEGREEEKGKEE